MSDNHISPSDPTEPIDVTKEIERANAALPIPVNNYQMPLDITIRSVALSVAARYIGDTSVKDASFYQALKLDNKLGPTADLNLLLHYALYLERYLWGEWSKDIAGQAMTQALNEMDKAIKQEGFEEDIVKAGEDTNHNPPTSG